MSFAAASSFQRYGQRDERRRRLLTDELCNSDERPACQAWPEQSPPPQKSEHYGDADFMERQWRLLDLVPRRLVVLGPLLAAGGAIVVGLEAAYAWMCPRAAAAGANLAALDIAAKGSLACWFSSLLLLAAAVMAVFVYAVRRHRTDDYQGRYRVWLWAAAGWLLMATDQAASLREAFQAAMIALTGTPLLGDGTLWWVAAYVLIFGAVGSRLLLDMRPSQLSMGALLAAAVAQALAMAGRLGWISTGGGVRGVMFQAGSEMAGNLMLLWAMALHARYVLLDAEGLLPRRQPAAEDSTNEGDGEETPPSANAGRWTKIDPPHAARAPSTNGRPVYQRAATAAAPAAASPTASRVPLLGTSSATPAPVSRKLTKAERKALKERLLRERLERQRGF